MLSIIEKYVIIIILYHITLLRLPQWLSGKKFLQCRKRFLQRNSRQQRTPAMQETIPASTPRSGRSPGEGHGNPLQYSCLENTVDRGAWQAAVHGVAKSQTWLKRLSPHITLLVHQNMQIKLFWTNGGEREVRPIFSLNLHDVKPV